MGGDRPVPAEPRERVDPSPVAIAPLDPKAVGSDEGDMNGSNVVGDQRRVEQGPPRHLLDALRARAGQPKPPSFVPKPVTRRTPLQQEPIILPADGYWGLDHATRHRDLRYLATLMLTVHPSKPQ